MAKRYGVHGIGKGKKQYFLYDKEKKRLHTEESWSTKKRAQSAADGMNK